ncbi:hypothetical protein ACC723_38585, partial [Rhizobium ruizarguesonis]
PNSEHAQSTTRMTKFSVCVASIATFNHRKRRRQAQSLSAFNLIDSRYREVCGLTKLALSAQILR